MLVVSSLYPSWIEIPVADLDRALAFYRAVFELAGIPVNFHVDKHAALERALATVLSPGREILNPIVDMGDGVRCVTLRDREGNPIALSSYEPLEGENA